MNPCAHRSTRLRHRTLQKILGTVVSLSAGVLATSCGSDGGSGVRPPADDIDAMGVVEWFVDRGSTYGDAWVVVSSRGSAVAGATVEVNGVTIPADPVLPIYTLQSFPFSEADSLRLRIRSSAGDLDWTVGVPTRVTILRPEHRETVDAETDLVVEWAPVFGAREIFVEFTQGNPFYFARRPANAVADTIPAHITEPAVDEFLIVTARDGEGSDPFRIPPEEWIGRSGLYASTRSAIRVNLY